MGQYYRGIVLQEDKKIPIKYIQSWDFGEGAKLMEHSYIDNVYVAVMEILLYQNPLNVVWAGDYADGEDKNDTESDNLYHIVETYKKITPMYLGKRIEWLQGTTIKTMLKKTFVVNHDKKVFYRRPIYKKETLTINPLPLLVCEGNQRGGGDYYGSNETLIGSWSRDSIEIIPADKFYLPNYIEIYPHFEESLEV